MTENRTTLKSYLETGDQPSQVEFEKIIDGIVNIQEDRVLEDSQKVLHCDSNRVDTYTATGSVFKPFKTLEAAAVHITNEGITGALLVVYPGTYDLADNATFTNISILGRGQVIVTSTSSKVLTFNASSGSTSIENIHVTVINTYCVATNTATFLISKCQFSRQLSLDGPQGSTGIISNCQFDNPSNVEVTSIIRETGIDCYVKDCTITTGTASIARGIYDNATVACKLVISNTTITTASSTGNVIEVHTYTDATITGCILSAPVTCIYFSNSGQNHFIANSIITGNIECKNNTVNLRAIAINGLVTGTAYVYPQPVHLAASSPTTDHDGVDTAGIGKTFSPGSFWINTATEVQFSCRANATGAAVWYS